MAFGKKPEFGAAKIISENTLLINVKNNNLIEENSVLLLNGKKIEGKHKNVATIFYGETSK